MSKTSLAVACKFQAVLKKQSSVQDEIEDLVSSMQNEGYVDEEILGMVEEALQRLRTSEKSVSRHTLYEPLTEVPESSTLLDPLTMLTERASVANKFQQVLKRAKDNK